MLAAVIQKTNFEFFYNHSAAPYSVQTYGNLFGFNGYQFSCGKGDPVDDFGNRYMWQDSVFAGNYTQSNGQVYSLFVLETPNSPSVSNMVLVADLNVPPPTSPSRGPFEARQSVAITATYRAGAFSPKVSTGRLSFTTTYMIGTDGPTLTPQALFTAPSLCYV
jgi:hypothetical protein